MVEVTNHDNCGSVDRCGRSILGGIDRPRLLLDPDAGVSLVVSKLQEGCLNQPVSSGQVPLRRDQAGGQFLQEVRQLEHFADAVPALCCLLFEGPEPRCRVPLPHWYVEDAQSQSPAILFLGGERPTSCREAFLETDHPLRFPEKSQGG
jgi:hypothetical protein